VQASHKFNLAAFNRFMSEFPIYTRAYIPGRPLYEIIKVHLNSTYFYKTDVKGFFDNIDITILRETIKNHPRLDDEQKKYLRKIVKQSSLEGKGVIQGSVFAALLSNIYLEEFDITIGQICDDLGLQYTRYSDDIHISGDYHIPELVKDTIEQMLTDLKLQLNKPKTAVISKERENHIKMYGINIIFGKHSNYITYGRKREENSYFKSIKGRLA
jgi:RNA-directed DNA polymerase